MKNIISKKNIFKVKFCIYTFAVTFLAISAIAAQNKIYIYAAASTTDVVKELIENYKKTNTGAAEFVPVFASAGDLAKQIEAGADASIFISADTKWVKYLDEKKMADDGFGHFRKYYRLAEND